MTTKEMLDKVDHMFRQGETRKAVLYMEEESGFAAESGDWAKELCLCNELMGYYRTVSEMDRSWEYAYRARQLVLEHGITGTVEGETTFLNIANVYRAVGNPQAAMEIYRDIEKVYDHNGLTCDNRSAGLFNNMMVTALELGDAEEAKYYGKKALEILERLPDRVGEYVAVSTNLAGVYLGSAAPDYKEAMCLLRRGEKLLLSKCENSSRYSANLAMQALIFYREGDHAEALKRYEKCLLEIEKHFGKNADYYRIEKNISMVKARIES